MEKSFNFILDSKSILNMSQPLDKPKKTPNKSANISSDIYFDHKVKSKSFISDKGLGDMYKIPKIDELDRLKKEINGWGDDIYNIQQSLGYLASQIDKIQNTINQNNSSMMLEQVKDEVLKCFKADNSNNYVKTFENIFYNKIKNWENQVFKPAINEITAKIQTDPQEIIKKLQEKIKYKQKLLKKKEIIEKLSTMKFIN
jgi:hypothetical protein